jgi:hypothetical protein
MAGRRDGPRAFVIGTSGARRIANIWRGFEAVELARVAQRRLVESGATARLACGKGERIVAGVAAGVVFVRGVVVTDKARLGVWVVGLGAVLLPLVSLVTIAFA